MKHTRRARRAQACTGKEAIATRADARGKAQRVMAQTGARRLNVYRCRFCRHWHIGRP